MVHSDLRGGGFETVAVSVAVFVLGCVLGYAQDTRGGSVLILAIGGQLVAIVVLLLVSQAHQRQLAWLFVGSLVGALAAHVRPPQTEAEVNR